MAGLHLTSRAVKALSLRLRFVKPRPSQKPEYYHVFIWFYRSSAFPLLLLLTCFITGAEMGLESFGQVPANGLFALPLSVFETTTERDKAMELLDQRVVTSHKTQDDL